MKRMQLMILTMALLGLLMMPTGCGDGEKKDQPTAPEVRTTAADAGEMETLEVELPEGTLLFPEEEFAKAVDPLASASALRGGTLRMFIGPNPKSLNYYLETSTLAATIFPLMYESLLSSNPITLDDEPGLARKWAVSPDKMTFTFWMDPKARWSDGRPITAHDVKYTFDAVMANPSTGVHQVYLGRFSEVKLLDDYTIQFTAEKEHWSNLQSAGGFMILPKHIWETRNFTEISFDFPVVSGLYRIEEFRENLSLTMSRREDYWDRESPNLRGKYNFATIVFRFYGDRKNAYDEFLNRNIDVFPVTTASRWAEEAQGERFDKNWVVKQAIYNYNPIGFQGFAMNMRREPFRDRRVRQAIAHLINRRKMNSTLMYNAYFMLSSYYPDLYTPEIPNPNPLYEFDKEQARALLREAGWVINPQTGLLEKNGRSLTFEILTRDSSTERFLAIMREDFKDVGIAFKTVLKDWSAWMKDMDDFNYDMTWAAWGAGVLKDPEGMWKSSEAERVGGSNITGFKSDKVDELIEAQRTNYDVGERHDIVRQIDQLVYAEVPYALLWNLNYQRVLYWNKFGTPPQVLSKYGDADSLIAYWWIDPDTDADLDYAIESGASMPKMPSEVHFDEVFNP